MSDFYIGYLDKAPENIRRFVRRIVGGLACLAITFALLLVLAQMPFANSTFEYGNVRDFAGVVVVRPYPTLLVSRPGANGESSRYLLVAPGKHGVDLAMFDGKRVHLKGQLIYRSGETMVEVVPNTVVVDGESRTINTQSVNLGRATLTGEIVDSKCYLGVMNPGGGKVHRDCAGRCLSGGIPPLFVTSDGGQQLLLVAPDGTAISREILKDFVAERITLNGELLQQGDSKLLEIDPQALYHQ